MLRFKSILLSTTGYLLANSIVKCITHNMHANRLADRTCSSQNDSNVKTQDPGITPDQLRAKVEILSEFLDETQPISFFLSFLNQFLFEIGYRGKTDQEPAPSFHKMKEELQDIEHQELLLLVKSDQLLFRGRYSDLDGWDYIDEMAKEVRKMRGLDAETPITLYDGTPEWHTASEKVLEEMQRMVQDRENEIDFDAAHTVLTDITRIRVSVFAQIYNFKQLLHNAWGLSLQNYTGSFTSGSEQAEAVLLDSLRELITYIDQFPDMVTEFLNKYPKPEFEHSIDRALASTASPNLNDHSFRSS